MCCRYVIPDEAAVERLCAAEFRRGFSWIQPLFNIAPTTQVPVIVKARDGAREIQGMRWGLIPAWWKQTAPPALTFNARTEEIEQKPVWRESFRRMRALMPARGWYEWNESQPARSPAGRKVHQPYFISCPGTEALAFAALWSVWEPAGGAPVASCALLTKPAAPAVAFVHPRMPVVLKPEYFEAWLDSAAPEHKLDAAIADARTDLEAYPVSTRVNDFHNDSPDLLARIPLETTGTLDLGG